jgi:hypothetical protein
MALSKVFNAMKNNGYVIKDLDLYLLGLSETDNDRAFDVNAPSSIGSCLRERYYMRMGINTDYGGIDARTRRIFDNGTKVHERLQEYLEEQGMLLMSEVPVISDEYNIQGHTDGVLKISEKGEKAVLEIKSINSNGFTNLKVAKPEHIKQGLTYIFCIEERRKYLRETYKTRKEFDDSLLYRLSDYAKHYQHFTDGHKYTRKQKIAFQCNLHKKMDSILYDTEQPITKAIFLYECKDNQELKEFVVNAGSKESEEIINEILEDCKVLDNAVINQEVPEREGTSKSCNVCRWCNFRSECWVV